MKTWLLSLPLNLINDVATTHGVDPLVIAAIVSVESSGETCATRYEPHYRWTIDPEPFAKSNRVTIQTEMTQQKTSWGLMQVMGAVAREYDFKGHLVELCSPKVGLEYGVKHFKNYLDKYSSEDDAISAYNQGSNKLTSTGKYRNQHYVDKVKSRVQYLKETI